MRVLLAVFLAFFLGACGVNLSLPKKPSIDKNELKDLNISYDWWKAYDNEKLNEFMDFVIVNNTDINVARSALLTALAQADLISYDLYPSLGASMQGSLSRNLNSNTQSKNFGAGLTLNYELDIYGKIRDSTKASEFSAKASAYDLQSLKLSIVNNALNDIFELAYFNDVEKLLQAYIANLEQMQTLYTFKYELGKIEELDLINTEQSLLQAKQNLLTNEQNRNLLIKNLQDLISKQEGFAYIDYFSKLSLNDFKNLNPNFNLSLKALAYRPDVLSKLNNLKAAFKDYSSVQKSLLPSISLGSSLSSQGSNVNDTFKISILDGNIQFSLPFLDYGKIRQNIKISQFAYESLLFQYEQTLQSAINEFMLEYKNYQSNNLLLENLQNINAKQELITRAYMEKYELGKSELKDYLDASNALNSSKQQLLAARFNLLKTINSYYQITTINYDEKVLNF